VSVFVKRQRDLTTLFVPLALLLTIVFSIAFGIGAGYLAILGILNAFSRNRGERKTTAAALISTAGPSGD
jgi:hypothetical protein